MPNPVTLDAATALSAMNTLTAADMLLVGLADASATSRPLLRSIAAEVLELRRTIARQYNATDLEQHVARLEARIAEQEAELATDRTALNDYRCLIAETEYADPDQHF